MGIIAVQGFVMPLTPRGILCWPKEQNHPGPVVCWLILPTSLRLGNWTVLIEEPVGGYRNTFGMSTVHAHLDKCLSLCESISTLLCSLGLLKILFSLSFKGKR